jgi:mannan endo-1,4-beta-mannosidase
MFRDSLVGELFSPNPAIQCPPRENSSQGLRWIEVARGAPYFITDAGEPWTPVGQNDAISWTELNGLFRRRDLPAVEAHLTYLKQHGVTCLRLMLEYAQVRHRYIERPVGTFVPSMVQLWDDLFALCERVGLRILLTPFDTFWTWLHWKHHPYNSRNGGPLKHPRRLLLCPEARKAIKARLTFAVERWGGSGALFAWDLWNEIHPAQAEESVDCFDEFIHDLSHHVRTLEQHLYGRSHPQTVSIFGPELSLRPHLPMREPIFRHPDLNFASLHIYERGAIDDPKNTVDAAISMGRIVQEAIVEIRDDRPFLDSEHGPIHTFKDHKITLPEPFDDEYFRHMQWAHLASGGAGGGMRWPNRYPHTLTRGMRKAQQALAGFLPLIDWPRFRRRCLNATIEISHRRVACFGFGDDTQAVVWLLRRDSIGRNGMLRPDAEPISPEVRVPGLGPGRYCVTAWNTLEGRSCAEFAVEKGGEPFLRLQTPPFAADLALAIQRR